MKLRPIEDVLLHPEHKAELATLRAEIADLRTMLDGERRTSRDALAELASMTSLCDRLAGARDAALARVGVLEGLVREADEALLWAKSRSPEAAMTMVKEATAWQVRARAALAPRSERREGEHGDGYTCPDCGDPVCSHVVLREHRAIYPPDTLWRPSPGQSFWVLEDAKHLGPFYVRSTGSVTSDIDEAAKFVTKDECDRWRSFAWGPERLGYLAREHIYCAPPAAPKEEA